MRVEEKDEEKGEPVKCGICFRDFDYDIPAYASKCGHIFCNKCLCSVQRVRQTDDDEPTVQGSRVFNCPSCRAKRKMSDFFRLHLDSYMMTPDHSYISLRQHTREHSEILAQSLKQLREMLESEKSFASALPNSLSSCMIGKVTLAKNRAKICDQFASNERKAKLEKIVESVEKVSVALALSLASVHKNELKAKMIDDTVSSILLKQKEAEERIQREDALRIELERQAQRALSLRLRAERASEEISTTLYGIGRNAPRSARETGDSDYQIVWLGTQAPSTVSSFVRATLEARRSAENEAGGGGEGDN